MKKKAKKTGIFDEAKELKRQAAKELDGWDDYYRKNKKRLDREAAEFEAKQQADELERKRSYVEDPLSKTQRHCCSEDSNCEELGLNKLIGGQIVDVGFQPWTQEGGLAIDYVKDGKNMRMIFAYTELGLWVEWQGETDLKREERSQPISPPEGQ